MPPCIPHSNASSRLPSAALLLKTKSNQVNFLLGDLCCICLMPTKEMSTICLQPNLLEPQPHTNSILTFYSIPILMNSPRMLCLQFLFFAHADTPVSHAFFVHYPPSLPSKFPLKCHLSNPSGLLQTVTHRLFCSPTSFCSYLYFST